MVVRIINVELQIVVFRARIPVLFMFLFDNLLNSKYLNTLLLFNIIYVNDSWNYQACVFVQPIIEINTWFTSCYEQLTFGSKFY